MNKETIAVFDFDGTITKKDTLLEFIKFTKGRLAFYLGFLIFSPLLVAMKLKIYPNWKVKQRLFSYYYKGVPIKEFNNWSEKFSSEIDKILSEGAIGALKRHKDNSNIVIVISASIENWIKPWAKNREVNEVLATKIEIDQEGVLTGRFLTKNCYGQEKVNRFLDSFPNRNEYQMVAYGNSRGDKEMLEFADEGFYNKFE